MSSSRRDTIRDVRLCCAYLSTPLRRPSRAGVFRRLRLPQHDPDIADLLSPHPPRKVGACPTGSGALLVVFLRRRNYHPIHAAVHPLRDRLFGGIGSQDSNSDRLCVGVFYDDGG